jgi:hypothetical protein
MDADDTMTPRQVMKDTWTAEVNQRWQRADKLLNYLHKLSDEQRAAVLWSLQMIMSQCGDLNGRLSIYLRYDEAQLELFSSSLQKMLAAMDEILNEMEKELSPESA